jgi:hypothetical protein
VLGALSLLSQYVGYEFCRGLAWLLPTLGCLMVTVQRRSPVGLLGCSTENRTYRLYGLGGVLLGLVAAGKDIFSIT